jgi:hypothetical protein
MDLIGFNLLHFPIAEVACSSRSFHPRDTPWFIEFSLLPEKGSAVRGRVTVLEGREFRKTHASSLLTLAVVPVKAGIQLSLPRVMTQSGIPAFAGMTVATMDDILLMGRESSGVPETCS